MAENAEVLERFRRGAELIATVMTGAAGSELDFRPAPGKWSVREIVAHLADSELVCGDRVRRLIAEDNPTLMAFDQEAWARNLNYGKRKTSESVESFRRMRAENFELVKNLPVEAFERSGMHSERGRETLRETVERMAKHVETHAAQIRAVRDLYKQSKPAKA